MFRQRKYLINEDMRQELRRIKAYAKNRLIKMLKIECASKYYSKIDAISIKGFKFPRELQYFYSRI